MNHRRPLLLALLILVPSCSKDGDTTIINQDVVPATPVVKEWRIPEMLGTANASSASLGDVRFDAAGNAVAVFMQNGVWARLWSPGTGWGALEKVSDSSTFGSGAKLAVDAVGNAIVVYSQLDDPSGGPETSIWWNRYTVGVGWGTPDLLESADMVDGDVQIAGDSSGNAIAVWGSTDGISTSDIMFNRYVAGIGWTGAAPLEGGPLTAGSARIGMDASGNAIAAWNQDGGTGDNDILSSRYVPGTGWTAPVPLETSLDPAFTPEIAVNSAGDAIAVWTQFDGVMINLWAASFRPASGWGAATLVETDDLWMVQGGLQVGIDGTGAGTAAWHSSDGVNFRVWTGRYSPAAGWTSVELLGELMNGESPKLAVNPSGATGIVWLHADGYRGNALFSSHDGAGPWTSPAFIEFYDIQCGSPVLAFDSAGNAIALWSYYETIGGFRTWANRFD